MQPILLTSEYLEALENDRALKTRYAARGAFWRSRLMAAPVLALVVCLLVLWGLYELQMLASIYTVVTLGLAAVAVAAIKFVFDRATTNVIEGIDDVPVVLARKIYGNDDNGHYHAIFSNGRHRHSKEFIDLVAQKIFAIDKEPDAAVRRKIDQLFGERLVGMGPRGTQLPLAFTLGEPVYHAEVSLGRHKDFVAHNGDRFAMIAFDPVQVAVIEPAHLAGR